MRISLVRVEESSWRRVTGYGHVALIPTRGLYNERPATWSIYSAWDTLAFPTDRWDAAYISLTMYFERGLVEAVLAAAKTL